MPATTTLTPKPVGPPRRPVAPPPRRGRWGWLVAAAGAVFLVVVAPVAPLAGAGNPPCSTLPSAAAVGAPPGGPAPGGMYARPLMLRPGRWYEVGATEYSGDHGAVGGSQGYLPAHPDTFAELSLLDSNPANGGTFTFADANALNNLPYMTGLLVQTGRARRILYKRDVGYGQGPGQFIANRQPYRIDVWYQAAAALGISKSPVKIALAPPVGAGNLLSETSQPLAINTAPDPACDQLAAQGPLQLTPGQRARILPDGTASAPASAPRPVKLAIAAANQIHTKPYPEPDVHYGSLAALWPAYDCSGSASYVLYRAGLHSVWPDASGTLETWGQPGPGKWITVYANSTHTWVDVAGLAFDTSNYGGPNIPAGSGPRWRQDPTGNLADGLQFIARHPPGL
jgi:hypothetical protein